MKELVLIVIGIVVVLCLAYLQGRESFKNEIKDKALKGYTIEQIIFEIE